MCEQLIRITSPHWQWQWQRQWRTDANPRAKKEHPIVYAEKPEEIQSSSPKE